MIEPSIRLRRAIRMKDTVLVKRVVQAHPTYLENPDFDDKSNTSLHLAAELGYVEIATLLLDAGHDANETSRNVNWETPLMIAADKGHVEVGRLLAERCGRSIPLVDKRGLNALSLASSRPASTALLSILLTHPTHPASISTRDSQGNTALHHASANGSLKALRLLLEAGADPGAQNAHHWTPLAYSQTVAAEVYFKQLIAEYEAAAVALAAVAQRSATSPLGHNALPLPLPLPHLERLVSAPSVPTREPPAAPLTRSLTAEPPPPPPPLPLQQQQQQQQVADAAAMPPPPLPRDRAGSGGSSRNATDLGRRRPVAAAGVRLVTSVDDDARAGETRSPSARRGGGGMPTPTHGRIGGYFDGVRMRAGSGD